jgi:hypothetical protein
MNRTAAGKSAEFGNVGWPHVDGSALLPIGVYKPPRAFGLQCACADTAPAGMVELARRRAVLAAAGLARASSTGRSQKMRLFMQPVRAYCALYPLLALWRCDRTQITNRDSRRRMTTRQANELIIVCSACVALLSIVLGAILLIAFGKLPTALLGSVTGVGTAGGLVGLALVPFFIIRQVLNKGRSDVGEQ